MSVPGVDGIGWREMIDWIVRYGKDDDDETNSTTIAILRTKKLSE
jgi:hypothetical protein